MVTWEEAEKTLDPPGTIKRKMIVYKKLLGGDRYLGRKYGFLLAQRPNGSFLYFCDNCKGWIGGLPEFDKNGNEPVSFYCENCNQRVGTFWVSA